MDTLRIKMADWTGCIPHLTRKTLDMGYVDLIDRIDALIMGRKTFETVCSFDCDWPYCKPISVLSNSMKSIPEGYEGIAELISGSLPAVIEVIQQKGHEYLYIDGGVTIQNFLKEDLIDELIITVIPILLGGGTPLFGELSKPMEFEHVKTETFLNAIVQNHYRRKK